MNANTEAQTGTEPVLLTADQIADQSLCQWPFVLPRRRPAVLPAGGHSDLPNGGQIVPRRGSGLNQFNGITPLPEVA